VRSSSVGTTASSAVTAATGASCNHMHVACRDFDCTTGEACQRLMAQVEPAAWQGHDSLGIAFDTRMSRCGCCIPFYLQLKPAG